jgi:hypothetical protein
MVNGKASVRTDKEVLNLVRRLKNGALSDDVIEMNLEEFRKFYDFFLRSNNRQVPLVVLVNLEDQVQVILPEWSRQEFLIEGKFRRDDFDFVSLIDWRGAEGPATSFLEFLREELSQRTWRHLVILALGFVALVLAGPSADVYDLLSSLLIQAGTVFLSIYLIFTVSQSETLSADRKLFDKGIFHRYHSDDRNVTRFAILTIALMFVNAILAHAQPLRTTLEEPLFWSLGRWIVAFSTSLVLTMLFHTFFIVSDYYLGRTRDIAERQHMGRIFHEEYRRQCPDDPE